VVIEVCCQLEIWSSDRLFPATSLTVPRVSPKFATESAAVLSVIV
jgi:hypothetical protein